jgi:hypothetical protein
MHQAKLLAQPTWDFLVGVTDSVAGVERHVGGGAALQQRVPLDRRQRARIVQRHQNVLDAPGRGIELRSRQAA